jgi:hypothetical protein
MSTSPSEPGIIRPGQVFLDQNGNVAQLHGIGILKWNDRFYAWGENKANGGSFTGISCYSSDDLATWRYEGESLVPGDCDLAPDRVIERPKVLHHAADGRFVMMLHVDSSDYSDARLGIALADAPAGPYRYLGSERPLGNLSRDIGVFVDDDATGYLLSEDREQGLQLYRLGSDYLSVESIVATLLKQGASHGYESPTMVKYEGLYYLFGSDLTGWSLNDNVYATASDPAGPWSEWRLIAPEGTHTFESQASVVLAVDSPSGARFVYFGDRWRRDALSDSPPVWLPLELGAGNARLVWRDQWTLAEL